MYVYTEFLIFLILLVILPDLYLYQRFMHNRANRSTSILHAVISVYFIVMSLSIMTNINRIFSPETSFRLTMFITILGAVYIPKVIFCTCDLVFFLTKKRWRWIQYSGYVLAFCGFLFILKGVFYNRFHFEKGEYTVEIDELPENFDDYKIAQISDLHLGTFSFSQEKLKPLMDSINAQHPDLIVFTGDLVNVFATETNNWKEIFQRLNDSTPKLAILGNHDYSVYFDWENEDLKELNSIAIRQKIRDFGFKLLMDKSTIIHRGTDSIAVIGTHNWGAKQKTNFCNIENALAGTDGIKAKILLTHDPTFWKDSICDRRDIALTISGHTHASQIGIEIGGMKLSPAKLNFDYWDGLYERNGKHIVVSRGVGCVGIPGRFGMYPQYSIITLKRKK